MSKIHDAVTAVLMCEGQLFLIERAVHLHAFPGFRAFPGGKVDKTESTETYAHPLLAAHEPRLIRALVRELREEIAFDLEAALASGEVINIAEIGIATAPPQIPVRFHTHFYRIDLKSRPQVTLDLDETASAEWATPAELIARYEDGRLLLAPPTLVTLRELAADPATLNIAGLHFEARDFNEVPMIEQIRGVRMIFVPSNTLPPATHTNAYLLGDAQSHRVLIDPSPANEAEYEKLKALCQRLVIHEVFLTHHHPDHRQYADRLARHFNAPLGLSQDTYDRIKARDGMSFFEGLSISTYREGDTLCRWLGRPVKVFEVPGHDEGQLALMPEGREWCIVGDLIQGVGTVVIAKPEGNMRKYFATLRRMIDLDPRVIFPSHGQGMGSVYRLKETLKHREQREQQIKTYLAEGKQPDEMLPLIYKDLDPRLLPLARMNIETHLDKLREEGLAA